MKLLHDRPDADLNVINGITAAGIIVNGQAWAGAVLVPWSGAVRAWPCPGVEALAAEHFAVVAALKPALVLFGSGSRLRFPPPEALRALIEAGIGLETMDTAAACRTYSVLVAESRKVVAALLP